jgi:adenylate kinase
VRVVALLRRLAEFRAANTDEETVLNYFDEQEVHPRELDATKALNALLEDCVKVVGKPHNYGPTAEEKAAADSKEREERARNETREREERTRREQEESADRSRREAEWAARLAEVRRQEEQMLEAQSVPLRNYLMKHVMPTLTQVLIRTSKQRPEDPIDFIAEQLFRANPANAAVDNR